MVFERIICLVADGLGVGELPDAKEYGDSGANTLGNLSRKVSNFSLPTLEKLGLGLLTPVKGVVPATNPLALVSRLQEQSAGKDTTTGHWELAGVVSKIPFPLFPQGFPQNLLSDFIQAASLPGVLGNKAASGTDIIRELGEEHVRTLKPVVYTSGDSVFQIAAHEKYFGLKRLYQICEIARAITLPLQIGRVIARPFIGESANDFKRTEHRRDYSLTPPHNLLDELTGAGVPVNSIGKIEDIFDHRGMTFKNHTGNNLDSLKETLRCFEAAPGKARFTFTNLVDFDMLYGHRRDAVGFGRSLKELDDFLPQLLSKMSEKDLLIITGDHGCDPTYRGSDHTREFVPLIAYSPSLIGKRIPDRKSFADVSASILKGYDLSSVKALAGASFL